MTFEEIVNQSIFNVLRENPDVSLNEAKAIVKSFMKQLEIITWNLEKLQDHQKIQSIIDQL